MAVLSCSSYPMLLSSWYTPVAGEATGVTRLALLTLVFPVTRLDRMNNAEFLFTTQISAAALACALHELFDLIETSHIAA